MCVTRVHLLGRRRRCALHLSRAAVMRAPAAGRRRRASVPRASAHPVREPGAPAEAGERQEAHASPLAVYALGGGSRRQNRQSRRATRRVNEPTAAALALASPATHSRLHAMHPARN